MARRKKQGTTSAGRDESGRFVEGNPGGPGRPPRPTEAAYLRATIAGCSLDDWRRIVERAKTDALNGDAKAREWLGGIILKNAPTLFDLQVLLHRNIDPVRAAVEYEMHRETRFTIDPPQPMGDVHWRARQLIVDRLDAEFLDAIGSTADQPQPADGDASSSADASDAA